MATILVIDDRPTEAANGLEGLDKVHREHPDLIITDLLMPGMDGFEFVRKLRTYAEQPNTPIIFCTATYLEPEARVLADACGPHHFVSHRPWR